MNNRDVQIKSILDGMTEEQLRVCPSENNCSCNGCVTSKGVSKEELAWYLANHTELKPMELTLGHKVYFFDEEGYPIGIREINE